MTRRIVLVSVLAAFTALACEAPTISGRRPSHKKSSTSEKADKGDDDDDDDDDVVATSTSDATEAEPAPAPAPKVDPFAGAPAFAASAPATDSSTHHLGTSNAGKDCLSCHGAEGGAPTFAFAGTLYQTKDGTAGASGAQVRVVSADGSEIALVNTDSAGNFWFKSATPLAAGARVGVRDGAKTSQMSAAIGNGGCGQSSCHTKSRPIFLGN